MKNLEAKKKLVDKLSDDLKSSADKSKPSALVFDYSRITVNELSDLRKQLKETGSSLVIVKNTLIKRVLQKFNIHTEDEIKGQHALMIPGGNDLISPINILYKFIKKSEKGAIDIGILNGDVISSLRVEQLSKLPTKEQLIAQVLAGFSSPARGLAMVLSGVQSKFVRALSKIRDQKSQ
ncbi:50S ribosomal protein L10 [candidate division WWE3 bacterium RIFCSPLOWO2_01_FULL_39_13]|uniref:Large ribosomal subunit protein uL10 n=1 Tax=candidate division WWE3 bacterium RIFCSPLOWO2_01_FULL_39_13 TaxID=1802624 RepID=A0A1F4V4A2_UNCKA|nr:MAG: 50S ribosomal protein L10 [candidate division WWE3 bacterium RIFCSPLOWO2_01_FULL_39_13]